MYPYLPVISLDHKFNCNGSVNGTINFPFNNICNILNLLNSQIKSQPQLNLNHKSN